MKNKRILREQNSIEKMITIYCRDVHRTRKGLCAECEHLLAYAKQKLDHCVFQGNKPVCAKCTIHCYQDTMRKKVIEVMRYAGPRMLYKYPVLAILHIIDSLKSKSKRLNKNIF
ncbi:MAG: nitrous oxide-stimulated promoter family protein [Pelosinus sp.]|nr:nitrous oxide-stimulated promoter family protein [Pelosinus sp.]